LLFALERFIEKKLLPLACSFLGIFKKKKPLTKENRNILVLRFWGVGETILTLPMIKALKEARPDSKITVFCTKRNESVFHGLPFIDRYRTIGSFSIPFLVLTNFRKYDLVIDSEPHFAISAILAFFLGKRSIGYNYGERAKLYDVNIRYNDSQHVVFTFCDLLEPLEIRARPTELVRLHYTDEARKLVELRFQANSIRPGRKPIIGIHAFCGPTAPWRAWPKERFAELVDKIKARHNPIIILTGTGSEDAGNAEIIGMLRDRSNVFNISNLPLPALFCLIEKYGLMISNDTGPMHIAAAQGVPTIGLFGPNSPVRFGPFPSERNAAFYHQTPNHPVINVHLNQFVICDGECMRLITVDEVFQAADRLLQKKG
jgi:heptosyltransferase-2